MVEICIGVQQWRNKLSENVIGTFNLSQNILWNAYSVNLIIENAYCFSIFRVEE
jgi:hypothetical protein